MSGGLDGQGHVGFAAQPGLRDFGQDVFNNPRGYGQAGGSTHLTALTVPNGTSPGSPWTRIPLAAGTPIAGLMVAAGYVWYLRRRRGAQRRALSGRA